MSDDAKLSIKILDKFAEAITSGLDTKPEACRFWLIKAFQAKRLQSQLLTDKSLYKSSNEAVRLASEAVADALEDPSNSVLTSIFMPQEIFLAMGIKPLIAEALSDYVCGARCDNEFVQQAENKGVPETYCSYHKILLGSALSGVYESPKLIANCSVACDANNITFKHLASTWNTPHAYIDVPYFVDEDAIDYVAKQLIQLASTTEDIFNRKLDEDLLKEYVSRSIKTQKNLDLALQVKANKDMKTNMCDQMMLVMPTHLSLGSSEALNLSQLMVDEYTHAKPFTGLNIVWVHAAPYACVALQKAIDENPDVQICACDMIYDTIQPDGFIYDESQPFHAMAERLCKNSFNGPATRRIERIKYLANTTNADGVVVFCHWGCKETMGASQIIKQELEAAGYPTLVLDGDGCHRNNMPEGQTATRIDAYLEMLKNKTGDTDE